MRRMTFSAYISYARLLAPVLKYSRYIRLMRYEDQLRSHPAYLKAAMAAIEIYLQIHDDPSLTEEKLSEGTLFLVASD